MLPSAQNLSTSSKDKEAPSQPLSAEEREKRASDRRRPLARAHCQGDGYASVCAEEDATSLCQMPEACRGMVRGMPGESALTEHLGTSTVTPHGSSEQGELTPPPGQENKTCRTCPHLGEPSAHEGVLPGLRRRRPSQSSGCGPTTPGGGE